MKQKTNFVIILADDMGYGDLSCLNDESKIHTQCMDRLAGEGMTFTDAHATSAVCTPSRYGLLTGRYAWRGSLQRSVLWVLDPPLLEEGRLTMADMLRQDGYSTACIGKWHLGMQWPGLDPDSIRHEPTGTERRKRAGYEIDYSRPIEDGPCDHGFDEYFGVDVPNFPPYCFIENDRTVGIPDIPKIPDEMYGAPGPMVEGWDLESIMPELTRRGVDYIHRQAKADNPFFLYFSMTGPHTPIVPTPEFQGSSEAGIYGDYVTQLDDTVGRIDRALQETGLSENTLFIVTSDNGSPGRNGSLEAPGTVPELFGHNPSWILRGMKADSWDGGHRSPFIAKWPSVIEAGSTCDRLICLSDLFETFATVAGCTTPEDVAEDSLDLSPYLRGDFDKNIREEVVHHSFKGDFGLRKGDWKLICSTGSGGFSADPKIGSYDPPGQLYNMRDDIREKKNLYFEEPDTVRELTTRLAALRGRREEDSK